MQFTLIDRYVLSVFIRVFLICFISLTGLIVIGDVVGHMHELIEQVRGEGNAAQVLATYYGAKVPWFFDLLGRVVVAIAAAFTVTWLQRYNEMTALMAAGVSRWRIVRPLVIAAVVIAGLAALNREVAIPKLRDVLSRSARDWQGGKDRPLQPKHDHQTDVLIDGQSTVANRMLIKAPCFHLPDELSEYGSQLIGKRAIYREATGNRPSGYHFAEVTHPANLTDLPSMSLSDTPVLFNATDTKWLKPGEVFVASNVNFTQVVAGNSWRQYASTAELLDGSRNPSLAYGADVPLTIHTRFVQPILDVTLLLLGLPLVFSSESRNVFVSAGSCLLMVIGYFVVVLAFQGMGLNYLISPSLAAWGPLFVLVPLAAFTATPLLR